MNAIPPRRDRTMLQSDPSYQGDGRFVARLIAPFFHRLLDRIDAGMEAGAVEGWLPDGTIRVLGGRGAGPVAEVRVNSWRALVRLTLSGSSGWYEAWEKGEWESPDPVPLFDLFMRNAATLGNAARAHGPSRWAKLWGHYRRRNHRRGSKRNIAYHYDLGNSFYSLWLDPTMSYSSAMFDPANREGETLEHAQNRKVHALLDRLKLQSGGKMLEIGCGWGHLALTAARTHGVDVTAITLSEEQHSLATRRVALMDLPQQVQIALVDYRDMMGSFDAIASVEMVEAVGQKYWPTFLDAVERLLKPGGRAAIQFISIDDALFERYAASADFIQTHVFPGGMLMSEARFRELAEGRGLEWGDLHHFGLDYAETLLRWRQAFDQAALDGRLPAQFDDRFVGLWRYYLQYCEGGFRGGGINVAQVTLTKPA